MTAPLTLLPIPGLPSIRPGDDLAELLWQAVRAAAITLARHDVLAVCQKVVSKAEGRVVALADVTPSPFASQIAAASGKDPRIVELILRESTRIVKMADGHLICETGPGWVCANAGIDESNAVEPDTVTLLPHDPDASAAALRDAFRTRAGVDVGVVITDTFGRPWRDGLTEVALGVAGPGALRDFAGRTDRGGRELHHTTIALADAVASAAGLLMEKDSGVAAVLVRGVEWDGTHGTGRSLIRPRGMDLFR
jgi:coenzyme F420-0:L-glutamate ligase/coenzyme F420-1:gamma-L-glutamate ligase